MKMIVFSLLATAAVCQGFAPIPGEEPVGCNNPHALPCISLRYSSPLKISTALGLTWISRMSNGSYNGVYYQLEPGLGGGKVNAGFKYGEYRFMPLFNAGLGVSLLYTWGDPLQNVESGETFIGVESTLGYFAFCISGGVFKKIAVSESEDDWIYSIGAGFGI